jgi:hypothetical protein
MACPHYTRENNDCLLLQEPPHDEEEGGTPAVDDPVTYERCLAPGKAYRDCPVFRRYLAELVP